MSALLRSYRPEDLPALLACWERSSRLAHPFLPEEYFRLDRERIPTMYLPSAATTVVEWKGRFGGFLSLLDNEIGAIFVEPELQGLGLGGMLLDAALAVHATLLVEVFEKNHIGRRFYAKHLFLPQSSRVHPETGHTLLRLVLHKDATTLAEPSIDPRAPSHGTTGHVDT